MRLFATWFHQLAPWYLRLRDGFQGVGIAIDKGVAISEPDLWILRSSGAATYVWRRNGSWKCTRPARCYLISPEVEQC